MKRLVWLSVFLALPALAQDRVAVLLQRLADAAGPPGFEDPVRALVVQEAGSLASSIRYDGMGSVIAMEEGSGPLILVDAHMDELGGMVRRLTPDGFATMQMLGGWLDQALVDQRWIIWGSKGPVHAVTGIRDIHVLPPEERARVFPREMLYLDVGARSSAEAAAMGLEVGDPVVPDAPFLDLNRSGNYLGKAWDDRVGCAVLLEAMRRLHASPHPNRLAFVFTTQGEIGLRGAHTAAEVVKPELGIALEAGVTGGVAGARPEETQVRLGEGPGLFLYDASELPNRKLVAFVKQAARGEGIPLQFDLVTGYGDDSAEIQKSNGGVPTVNLVVPVRYTHAHNGIVNRRDFDRTVDLVVALLRKLDAPAVASIRDFRP
jgi:putative aminopeptidase FrvX